MKLLLQYVFFSIVSNNISEVENVNNNASEVENVKPVALKKNNVQATANINEEILDKVIIDPNHVQIRVSTEELNRRIESFIERKRRQVNIVNVREFCSHRLVYHYC